jgi:hypothetical protein
MGTFIASLLIAATLLSGSVTFASANTNSAVSEQEIYRISAFDVRNHFYKVRKGERVTIELSGDTFTNLDLYVYDANGYLIDTKLGRSDYEVSYITVFADTTLTVKVVNRGRDFNDYDLSVWVR